MSNGLLISHLKDVFQNVHYQCLGTITYPSLVEKCPFLKRVFEPVNSHFIASLSAMAYLKMCFRIFHAK